MLTVIGVGIFAGAFGASICAIAGTVVPRLDRIISALRREVDPEFHPLAALVQAERRIAIRRWSNQPRAAASIRMRAAA